MKTLMRMVRYECDGPGRYPKEQSGCRETFDEALRWNGRQTDAKNLARETGWLITPNKQLCPHCNPMDFSPLLKPMP